MSHNPAFHMMTIVAALVVASASAAGTSRSGAAVTRYQANQLGGITEVLRYEIARPDRTETRFLFLTGSIGGADLPQEVQVTGVDGAATHLSDQDGSECTLAHVEIIPGRHPMVVTATRIFSPDLKQNDQSQPGVMEVQVYNPVSGGDVGQSEIMLRATAAPHRTQPLCSLADTRAVMLRLAKPQSRR